MAKNKLTPKDLAITEEEAAQIPELYRVLLLLQQAGWSYADIAAGNGPLPVGTVKSRISRGKDCLTKIRARAAKEAA